MAQASTAVLLLTRGEPGGAVPRAGPGRGAVRRAWATPAGRRPSLGVVVTGALRDRRSSVEQVRQVLASIGSPAPVIGFVAHDPAGAQGLWAGELTRRFAGSDLVRAGPRDRGVGARGLARTGPAAAPEAGEPLRHNHVHEHRRAGQRRVR